MKDEEKHPLRLHLLKEEYVEEGYRAEGKILDNVSEAKYYSQKDAKAYAVANSPKTAGLKSFAEEFFPSFIEIVPQNTETVTLDKIVDEASHISGVDEVSYGKEYMVKFQAISGGAWLFISLISILFALSAVFVIYNTIKVSLYKFKDEIKLYSLVGATRPFISVPYLFGALFLSIFAYIISYAIFMLAFIPFNNNILIPSGINIYNIPSALYFVISSLVVCLIGVFASQASVVSFLKQVSSINED